MMSDIDPNEEAQQEATTTEEPYDAGNKKHVREAATRARLAERDHGDVIRALMDNRNGRAFLLDLMAYCGTETDAFMGNPHTFYALGRQSVGRWIKNLIHEFAIDRYVDLVKEQKEIRDNLVKKGKAR